MNARAEHLDPGAQAARLRRPLRVLALVVSSFILTHLATGHPADQSAMRVRAEPERLEIRLTFNLLTLARFARLDADGDGRLAFPELKAGEPAVARYLNEHILLEMNGKKAGLGANATFDYLWPRPAQIQPMAEPEYSLQKADVIFRPALEGRMLEDVWIGFQIFEQTGPLHTIAATYESGGQVLDVSFSVDEPEYLYDTGFAESPPIATTGKSAPASKSAPPPPASSPRRWLLWIILPLIAILAWMRWRARAKAGG